MGEKVKHLARSEDDRPMSISSPADSAEIDQNARAECCRSSPTFSGPSEKESSTEWPCPTEDERLRRWRLVLGKEAQQSRSGTAIEQGLAISLMGDDEQMDKVLEVLYESDRSAGLGSSCPNVNRWLGDIRTYFPKSVVQVMQKDALERLNLQKMLLEPETLENDGGRHSPGGNLARAQQRHSQENARDRTQGGAQGRGRPRAPSCAIPMTEAVRGALSKATPHVTSASRRDRLGPDDPQEPA